MSNNNNIFTLIQSFPIFEPNQVLTDKQLNSVVSYLEQQERLTRFCAAGMGIIGGLQANWEANGLRLTEGFGLTSEGYLIQSPDSLLTHFREVKILPQWFGLDPAQFPQKFEGIYELVPAPEMIDNELIGLQMANLAGRVLVLVLEVVEDNNDHFCHNDCDERGNELNFILHKLLIPIGIADTVLKACYDHDKFVPALFADLEELFYYKYFLAFPHIERFGHHTDSGTTARLNDINNYSKFQDRYKEILTPMANRIDAALQNVHKIFSPVFTPGEVPASSMQLAPTLKNHILTGTFHRFEVQYLNDYLCDLVHAYLEFVEQAFDLIADFPANMHRFPKHLFIRLFDEASEADISASTVYRTPYTQPPIYNGNQIRLEEVRTLYRRLEFITKTYQTPDMTGISETRITPGRMDAQPLGQRAMPFYYPPSMAAWWNPRRRRMGRTDQVYSYHRTTLPPYNDPLVFHMEGSDFLRIEGHVGKPFETVLTQLSDYRQKYNLPFQVVALKIGEEFNEALFQHLCDDNGTTPDQLEEAKKRHLFHNFAGAYPGMEHRGGVPVGGTFIVAYVEPEIIGTEIRAIQAYIDSLSIGQEEKDLRKRIAETSHIVVADFYLPYACLSCAPPICFVASRPHPILLVSPTVFCGGDTTAQELTITTHPGGGVLTGPGYKFENGQHLFTPADSGVEEGSVLLKYYIDGGEASVILTIVRQPNAVFHVMNETGGEVDKICQDGGLLLLVSESPGGVFSAWDGSTELAGMISTNENNQVTFNPAGVTLENGEPLQVEIRYALEGNFCDNLFSLIVMVLPVPDAEFTFEENVTEICKDTGPVRLLPNLEGGTFGAFINNTGPITGATSKDQGIWSFVPAAIPLGQGESVIVTLRHTIVSEDSCPNSAEHNLIVWSAPDAKFRMPATACQNAGPVTLTPNVPGGTFTALVEDGVTPEGLIAGNLLFPDKISAQGEVNVIVTYTLTVGVCTSTETKPIMILPVPVSSFEAEFITNGDNKEGQVSVRVFNIQPAGGKRYNWTSDPVPINGAIPVKRNNEQFTVTYQSELIGPKGIILTLSVVGSDGGCQSPPVEKIILPVIQFTELIGVIDTGEGKIEVTNIFLQEGLTIQLTSIDSKLFKIRAYPLPFVVGKVNFELTGPNGPVTGSSDGSKGGYYLFDDQELPVLTGSYNLKVTPFTMLETAGTTLEINFFITEKDVILSGSPPADLPGDTITFLRRRDAGLRKELESLGTDTGLADTTAFKLTQSLMSFQGEPEALNKRFIETMNTLTQSATKAKTGSPRHAGLLRLMTVATEFYMDRQVVTSPDNLGPGTKETLESRLPDMKKAGLDMKTLRAKWKGNDLKKTLSAPAADTINKMLK